MRFVSSCEPVFAWSSPAQTLVTAKRLLSEVLPGTVCRDGTADGWCSPVLAKCVIRSSNLDNLKFIKGKNS